MAILVLILALVVIATVGIGLLGYRVIPARFGGPTTWGRAIALRLGSVAGAATVAIGGWLVIIAVMLPVGWLAKASLATVDQPIYNWIHGVVKPSAFTKFNAYFTVLGDRSMTYLLCATAIVILAFAYRQRWWVPVVALVVALTAQLNGQNLLATIINRSLPPVTNAGTFPSGGVSRPMIVFGITLMLVLLLFPQLSHRWQAGLWIGVITYIVVEAFTRLYLSLHWLTDDLAGLLFGGMLLLVFTTATAALSTRTARLVGRSRQLT